MNNIKFRIWDGTELYYASCIDLLQGYPLQESKCFSDNLVFQQFTGKYDSKGEPIYEGDILYYSWKVEHGEQYETCGEVFYDDESAAYLFDRISQFSWLDSNINWNSLKIIGNSLETPELLQ